MWDVEEITPMLGKEQLSSSPQGITILIELSLFIYKILCRIYLSASVTQTLSHGDTRNLFQRRLFTTKVVRYMEPEGYASVCETFRGMLQMNKKLQ